MKEIAIYTRQSIDKKDSISVETQFDTCKLRLTEEEGKRAERYSDKGYSGKNTNRPELQKLISKIKKRKVEKVVVYKLDRISRNITDFYKLYEIMENHGCEFCSATENFDTTNSMGKAMMGILAIFAQMERENIQKRVKDNYYDRTEKLGSWPGGPAPYGFTNAKTEDRRPTLIPNETEKPAIEFLFDSYAKSNNISLGILARTLTEKGFKSRKREGGTFDNVTIARILKNTVYVKADEMLYYFLRGEGIRIDSPIEKWDGTHSAHIINKKPYNKVKEQRAYTDTDEQVAYLTNFSGFINSATYIKVQKRLKENKQIGRANGKSKLEEFAGKLKCGKCGRAIKIYNGNQISCYGNVSLHSCDARFNKRGYFDKLMLKDIRDRVAVYIANYYSMLRFAYKKKVQDCEKLKNERAALDKKINSLVGTISELENSREKEPFINSIKEYSSRIVEIDYKIASFAAIDPNELKENINYYSLSLEKRKAIINKLVDKIIITDNSANDITNQMPYKVDIVWKTEITEEQKESFSKAMQSMTEEKMIDNFIETYSCLPAEDYKKYQEEAKRSVDKILRKNNRKNNTQKKNKSITVN